MQYLGIPCELVLVGRMMCRDMIMGMDIAMMLTRMRQCTSTIIRVAMTRIPMLQAQAQ